MVPLSRRKERKGEPSLSRPADERDRHACCGSRGTVHDYSSCHPGGGGGGAGMCRNRAEHALFGFVRPGPTNNMPDLPAQMFRSSQEDGCGPGVLSRTGPWPRVDRALLMHEDEQPAVPAAGQPRRPRRREPQTGTGREHLGGDQGGEDGRPRYRVPSAIPRRQNGRGRSRARLPESRQARPARSPLGPCGIALWARLPGDVDSLELPPGEERPA